MITLKNGLSRILCVMLVLILCITPMNVSAESYGIYPSKDSDKDYSNGITADYRKISLRDLYSSEKLTVEGDITVSELEKEAEDGLLLSGKQKNLSKTALHFADPFDFSDGQVGRITIDALAKKRTKVHAFVYLDEDETPVADLLLKKQKKDGNWYYDGDVTANVEDAHIQGKHEVTIRFQCDSDTSQEVLLRSIEFVKSSIPVVYLDIDESEGTIGEMNSDGDHEAECYGNMTIQVPDGYVGEYGSQKNETYTMEYIRGRGNSTWIADKKPYKIKLEKKANLFGMGKNKHWVLLANRYDNSFLRNKMTYWLGKSLGMEFTPECVFVDVVMNGTYLGSYYLSEQVRVGESRVDIDDLTSDENKEATDPETISGGYLLSMEPYGDEDKLSFETEKRNSFLIESPDFDGYENEAQYKYISNYVQTVEDAIYGKGFKTADGTSYKDLMDVNSAVDYWWIQELSMNGDAFVSTSTYLYKKRNGKLYWGPLWDFDYVAWASYDMYSDEDNSWEGYSQTTSTWFQKLLLDKEFSDAVQDRWPDIQKQLAEITKDGGILDQYYEQLKVSQYYDFEKWGANDFDQEEPLTFKEEVDRLRRWIDHRSDWITNNLNLLEATPCECTFVANDNTIEKRTISRGDYIGELPTAPKAQKGYTFVGWFSVDDEDEEYRLYENSIVYYPMTIYAKYLKESEIVHAQKIHFLADEIYVSVDDFVYLNYTITPFDSMEEDNVTWTCDNTDVLEWDGDEWIMPKKEGIAKVTATLENGVSKTITVHVISDDDINYFADFAIDKHSLTMKPGAYDKLTPVTQENDVSTSDSVRFVSSNSEIVEVTDTGVLYAHKAGKATIVALGFYGEEIEICTVNVKDPSVKKGDIYTVKGLKYKVTSTGSKRTVTLTGVAGKKKLTTVTIPSSVKCKGKSYKVTAIGSKAFKKQSKLAKITIKSTSIKSIGKDAFSGIKKNAKFKIPAKCLKKYKKLLSKKTGFKKTMKVSK
ncbi:MAG: CotH kinase family protein [Lachnospiraceae bacterium]|nr:CotH kinase family protein [Lachnospiraceae bacterium]